MLSFVFLSHFADKLCIWATHSSRSAINLIRVCLNHTILSANFFFLRCIILCVPLNSTRASFMWSGLSKRCKKIIMVLVTHCSWSCLHFESPTEFESFVFIVLYSIYVVPIDHILIRLCHFTIALYKCTKTLIYVSLAAYTVNDEHFSRQPQP